MFRITRQTDYGIILLTYIASRPAEDLHTARDVAAVTRLPLPMVSKILKTLAREGILGSHRGVKGGYSLSRPPDRLTLADIIRALEGPIGITDCSSHPGSCDQEPFCPTRINWQRISFTVREALESIPLSEMLGSKTAALIKVGPEVILPGTPSPRADRRTS